MSRLWVFITTAAIAAACFAPQASASRTPAPTRYVAMGDSVAQGVYASDPSKTWVHQLFAFLSTPVGGGLDTPSYDGIAGETTTTLLQPNGQMDTALAQIDDPGTDTKFVSIEIGANDALGTSQCAGGVNVAPCPFAANFADILDGLNAALAEDPGVETLEVVGYYNPGVGLPSAPFYDGVLFGADGRVDCSGTGADLGLSDLITCIGRAKGAVVADPYWAFQAGGQAFIFADGLHPSDAGYAAIAAVAEHPCAPHAANHMHGGGVDTNCR